jgi:hypothetical protein
MDKVWYDHWSGHVFTEASADLAAERIDSVRAAKLQEIELDLQAGPVIQIVTNC